MRIAKQVTALLGCRRGQPMGNSSDRRRERQARRSGVVMGFDTHMVAGSRACSISTRPTHPTITNEISPHYAEALESRRAAEEARQLLNQLAGGMTKEQAQTLGQLFNRGEWAGVMRHNRFLPAFAGATMDRLLEPIETFNEWTRRLWRSPEEEALQAVDEVLRNPNAFPGAGRSYPTMLMYLRDPHRFAIWLQVCHQGLIAISDYDEPRGRTGGVDRYLRYCAAVREFAER